MRKVYWFMIGAVVWQTVLLFRLPRFVWGDGMLEPWFVTRGLMFHKDFYSTYLPLPKIVMIPVNILFGWRFASTIIVGYLLVFVVLLTVVWVARGVIKRGSLYKPIVVFCLWYGYLLAQNTTCINLIIGWLVLVALGIYFSWLEGQTRMKAWLMGVVGMAAVFSTQHTAIPISVLVGFMVVYWWQNKGGKGILGGFVFWVVLGMVMVAGPILTWYGTRGALSDLYFWAVDYYLRDTGYPFSRLGYSERDLVMFGVFSLPLVYIGFYFLGNVKIVIEKLRRGDRETWKLVGILGVVLVSVGYAMMAIFHPRRLVFILPSMSILAVWIMELPAKRGLVRMRGIMLAVYGLYILGVIWPWYGRMLWQGTKYNYANVVQPGEPDYMAVEWIRENTKEEATLHVFAGNNLNYLEADRLPVDSRTYALPWVYEPIELTAVLFEQKPADYWIVDTRMYQRYLDWGYPHQVEFLQKYLAENYKVVATYDWMLVYELAI